MDNKVLVTINVPYLENKYDVYVPVNRKVYSVIKMLSKTLYVMSQGAFDMQRDYVLYDSATGNVYNMNLLVRDTDIRNGSTIIML